MATKSGLVSISQGRSDMFRVDPRQLHIKAGWNSRDMSDPANVEHVDMLAKSIAEVGVKEPLTVFWENGKAFVSDGHCRLLGAMRAIEVYKADSLKTVPVKTEDRHANDADRLFSQVLRNSGKPFSQMEQAKVFKRLLDLGWQQGDIAKKAGVSAGRVSQILGLLVLPEPVKAMVAAGNVSPSMAVQVVKASANGSEAEQALKAGLAVAQAEGKNKVKPSHMEPMPAAGGNAESRSPNIKTAVIDAFEYADVDDSAEDFVVIKMPTDKWEVLRTVLKL